MNIFKYLRLGWSYIGSMHYSRRSHKASVLTNGQVLVTGGIGSEVLNSAELYHPLTGTWKTTGDMNRRRYHHAASLLTNGKVLITGGDNGDLLNSILSCMIH
jgi:N-acetylneuraminic acid mutarotase